ncbi:unnamed protein product [Schistosoma mattheei]|uniref:Uncharacterized protein n=1 Tax=Schistosoma mattheei TaxID=31246 RepID=A0A183Q724_9TREM|nr:unnamed protein product [Schistosoma mattheei]
MLSSYQIPISNNNNNNNEKKNEHLSRITLLNNSIGNLSSPRNSSSLITNSMNTNTVLNSNNTNTNSNIGVNTSRNNDYINGNESNGNYTTSSSILGSNSRIFNNCAECGLRIINLIDTCYAMGYLYHNSCFVCCCCSKCLNNSLYICIH